MSLLGCSLEDDEIFLGLLIEFQDGCHIPAVVAVIRCRPHSKHGLIEMPLVTFHHRLVDTADDISDVDSLNWATTTLPNR